MPSSITIQKHPLLPAGSDYALLRQKGLDYIQALGSAFWTDYNLHDPGITILEALCYALTDLGYRTSFPINDLLVRKNPPAGDDRRQGFFTAKEILTVNPLTVRDYRKLLIDIDGVKNGWLHCKQCSCEDIKLYPNCKESVLQYVPVYPPVPPLLIKGLYDVLVEFEDEEKSGNLNSGKIWHRFHFKADDGYATAAIEMRLPSWHALDESNALRHFRQPSSLVTKVTVNTISKVKASSGLPLTDIDLADKNVLRRPVFATLTVEYDPAGGGSAAPLPTILLQDVPLTLWFNSTGDRKALAALQILKDAIGDVSAGGPLPKYLAKIKRADEVMATATAALHGSRNLAEDYCTIRAVQVEDIAVCADMEVTPDADIEAVLAEAYYRIDQYFSADIKFYSLKELVDSGMPVEDIFEGPRLHNGFLKDEQLESTNLKKALYVSDILNLLMDIDGVRSVKNLVLTRYDEDGNIALRKEGSKMVGDSQTWSMPVSYNHQPRLYAEASKILVFKNGLPFLPDPLELSDSLQVVKAKNAQPKFAETENDLPVPKGRFVDVQAYYPVQYSLPQTYGVSEAGLPSTATPQRRAQAKQLKAYLLFFEQMLVNYLQQLANVNQLFAIDKTVKQTYFTSFLTDASIAGLEDAATGLYKNLTATALQGLVEKTFNAGAEDNDPVFLDRRNRFLDHLLARFGEQFSDYALMLYSYTNDRQKTSEQLIDDKIDFLRNFPLIGAARGRALNYKDAAHVCSAANAAGLQTRIELLLNLDDKGYLTYFDLYTEYDGNCNVIDRGWRLVDEAGNVYLVANQNYANLPEETAKELMLQKIENVAAAFTNPDAYSSAESVKWDLQLRAATGDLLARSPLTYNTRKAALEARDRIVAFGEKLLTQEKLFVVEHLLLRPRNRRIPALYFELYEEKDKDGKLFEQRWRLIDSARRIYLSSSTRYFNDDLEKAIKLARIEIDAVCRHIYNPSRFAIKRAEKSWVLNLVDDSGEIIATRKQHFATETAAIAARDQILQLVQYYGAEGTPLGAGQLFHSGNIPAPGLIADGDPLLPVCLTAACCDGCGDEDPYSFRITVVVNGEDGPAGTDMAFRQFAEETIRLETPAHIGVKVCWVSKKQWRQFAAVYCRWRTELATPGPDRLELHNRLVGLLDVFAQLKNVYPPATLHDCVDGNDENRVFLGRTII